jgi:hypothetical protein
MGSFIAKRGEIVLSLKGPGPTPQHYGFSPLKNAQKWLLSLPHVYSRITELTFEYLRGLRPSYELFRGRHPFAVRFCKKDTAGKIMDR